MTRLFLARTQQLDCFFPKSGRSTLVLKNTDEAFPRRVSADPREPLKNDHSNTVGWVSREEPQQHSFVCWAGVLGDCFHRPQLDLRVCIIEQGVEEVVVQASSMLLEVLEGGQPDLRVRV